MKNTGLRTVLTEAWRDQRGATAIEYALIGAVISIVILSALTVVGEEVLRLLDVAVAALGG
ncbi:MAG: Flp family type IVb pilin [Pseudomonadota bacterium]